MAWRMSWQYLAGFLDGEGSINCYDGKQYGKYKGVRRVFRIQIYQNSEIVLEEIQRFLQENKISSKLRHHLRPEKYGEGHPGSWMLTVEGVRDTFRFLCKIEKYVIVKHMKVQESLAYIENLIEQANQGELHGNSAKAYANLKARGGV